MFLTNEFLRGERGREFSNKLTLVFIFSMSIAVALTAITDSHTPIYIVSIPYALIAGFLFFGVIISVIAQFVQSKRSA